MEPCKWYIHHNLIISDDHIITMDPNNLIVSKKKLVILDSQTIVKYFLKQLQIHAQVLTWLRRPSSWPNDSNQAKNYDNQKLFSYN